MTFTRAISILFFGGLMLFHHGCADFGPTMGTDHAMVQGGKAYVTVSPSLAFMVPVNVEISDKVAEAAANAAVRYLKGLPAAITALQRAEAVQQGVDAGVKTAAETGQSVDQEKLKTFVREIVAKIGSLQGALQKPSSSDSRTSDSSSISSRQLKQVKGNRSMGMAQTSPTGKASIAEHY